jgi:RNA polymerase sigma factor (sigma-70 family)
MWAVLEHGAQSRVDDDLIPVPLLAQVQAYLAARARHLPPSPQSAHAWLRFYRICDNYIRRAAARSTRPGEIDDCVQQVWVDVLTCLPRFAYDRSRGGFRAFLATLVHSKSIDLIRRRARHPLRNLRQHLRLCASDPNAGPDDACEHTEELRQVRLLLLRLCCSARSASFRIFYRRCILGQSTEEVADRMGLAPDQVRFRLHRMRQRVRQIVAGGLGAWSGGDGGGMDALGIPPFPGFRATDDGVVRTYRVHGGRPAHAYPVPVP